MIFVPLLAVCVAGRTARHADARALGVDHQASDLQPGGNMEGKEVALRHRQLRPLGDRDDRRLERLRQLDARLVHAAGRAGADVADAARRSRSSAASGSGLYGMLVFAIVAVFVAGLMVGRTPEYLGKKIEAYEMKMASLVILIPPVVVLSARRSRVVEPPAGTRERSSTPAPTASAKCSTRSRRPATTTAAPSPGSARTRRSTTRRSASRCSFARYWLMIPTLAIAGSLARKKTVPPGAGTLPTHTPLFVVLLVGVVVLVGALTFIPALALGPIVEHLHDHGAIAVTTEVDYHGNSKTRPLFDPADRPAGAGRLVPEARSRATRSATR